MPSGAAGAEDIATSTNAESHGRGRNAARGGDGLGVGAARRRPLRYRHIRAAARRREPLLTCVGAALGFRAGVCCVAFSRAVFLPAATRWRVVGLSDRRRGDRLLVCAYG